MSAAELHGVSRVWQNLKTTLQQRTSEVDALKAQLQVLIVKYDSLQESSSQAEFHLRQQVEASLVEVSKAQMHAQVVQQEKKELQHRVSHLEMESQTLERKLQVKTQECEDQERQLHEKKELQHRVSHLEREAQTADRKLQATTQECEEQARQLHEKKELQFRVSHLEIEAQGLERKLQAKTHECEEQARRVEDLKQRVVAIENKSAVVIGKTLIDQKELRSLQQRHAELEQAHANLQQLHDSTHRQLTGATARLGETREAAQSEAAGRRHASQQSERLEAQVRALLADNKLLAGRLQAALVKLGRRKVDRAHLQKQAADLSELADQIDAARQQSRAGVERARADVKRLLTILGDFYGEGKDLTAGLEDHTFVRRKQAFMEEFQGLCERCVRTIRVELAVSVRGSSSITTIVVVRY